jgi:hypothetical protein
MLAFRILDKDACFPNLSVAGRDKSEGAGRGKFFFPQFAKR